MKFLFIFVVIIGAIYFLFKKRVPDFFTIAFFSAIVYFLPGFFGYVLFPPEYIKVKIENKTYIIFIIVLVSIILFAIISDYLISKDYKPIGFDGTQFNVKILVIISVISFISMIATIGPTLFTSIKSQIMEELNRFYVLWTTVTVK